MVESPRTFGKYRLLKRLAQGGMAEIFLARQAGAPGRERLLVIKRVLPRLNASADFVKMFLDEARTVARLDHPSIVRVFDLGQIDGQYYLAMEYVAGEDQGAVLRQAKALGVQVPLGYAAELIHGAALALTSAHQAKDSDGRLLRVVHRDVSPSNILTTWQGAVKLVDFGVAHTAVNSSRTEDGVVKGKLSYLSPEQCRATRADSRTDLYALGVVLYELITCTKLFVRDSPFATVKAILAAEVPPLERARPGVPQALQAVVKRAMALDPDQRYQSGAELAADLERFLAGTDWVRGTGAVAFLTSLFGEERRQAKLRLAGGEELDDEGYAALDRARPSRAAAPAERPAAPLAAPGGLPTRRLGPRRQVRLPLGAVEPSGLLSTLDQSHVGAHPDEGDVSTEPLRPRPDGLEGGALSGPALDEPKTSPSTSVSGLRATLVPGRAPEPSTSPATLVPSSLHEGPTARPGSPMPADAESPTIGLGIARPSGLGLGEAALPSTSLEQPRFGRLRIHGPPAEAQVTVNGAALGAWAEENALPVGAHLVAITAPGLQRAERLVELLPDALCELEVKLEPV